MKIAEIAQIAGVSKSAVSLPLNGKPGVSEETRERIVEIAKETGYLRKTLKKAKTVSVQRPAQLPKVLRFIVCTNHGIVSEEYQNQSFFTELLHDIEDQCKDYRCDLLYSTIRHDDFQHGLQRVQNSVAAEGTIVLGTNLNPQEIEAIASISKNIVVLDTLFTTMNHDFVVMNNAMGAHQAAEYLVGLGHTRIGYVQSVSRMQNFDERKQGFYAALKDRGLSIPGQYVVSLEPTITTVQPEFLKQWSDISKDKPTALFCECDYMAISVIKGLLELGLRVPDDVSVIGFDDIRESTIVVPELTTIHVPKQQMAKYAVRQLISSLTEADFSASKIVVDTSLIERRSCGEPKVGD